MGDNLERTFRTVVDRRTVTRTIAGGVVGAFAGFSIGARGPLIEEAKRIKEGIFGPDIDIAGLHAGTVLIRWEAPSGRRAAFREAPFIKDNLIRFGEHEIPGPNDTYSPKFPQGVPFAVELPEIAIGDSPDEGEGRGYWIKLPKFVTIETPDEFGGDATTQYEDAYVSLSQTTSEVVRLKGNEIHLLSKVDHCQMSGGESCKYKSRWGVPINPNSIGRLRPLVPGEFPTEWL